jgi:hypothetical protein
MQMSIIEGYFNDGQEVTKIDLIDDDSYVKDKSLLNIIQGLYDKQNLLGEKYKVSIQKNMYKYVHTYIHKYLKLDEEYLDIILYDEICTTLPTSDKNQFPSYIATIYFIDDNGIQVFGNPTNEEVIDSIKQLIKNIEV